MHPYILTEPVNAAAARVYLAWVREVRALLAAGTPVMTTWSGCPHRTPESFRAEFVAAVERRINDRAGGLPRGRKWDGDYAAAMRRDAGRIADRRERRVRIYQFETAEVRRRCAHLLSDRRED